MARKPAAAKPGSVVVIGLGRFGSAVADSLVRLGHEVLAIDEDATIVQSWASRLTHVVQADTTSSDTLDRLGVAEFEKAVVAIGTDIEASLMTVLALSELGVPDIWAKASAPSTVACLSALEHITSSIPRSLWASAWPIWLPDR